MVKPSRIGVAIRTDVGFLATALLIGAMFAGLLVILNLILGERVSEIASVVFAGSAVFFFRKLDARREPSVVARTAKEPGGLMAGLAGTLIIFSGTLPSDVLEKLFTAALGDITQVRRAVLLAYSGLDTLVSLGGFFIAGTILGKVLPTRALYACLLGVSVYTVAAVVRALTLPESAYREMAKVVGDAGGRTPSVVGAFILSVLTGIIAVYGARLGSSSARRS
ncbi:MAG TPA: hypothetical protein VEM13_06355 [Gemmatimonadales bacterium]|nr:hypothetical protein [Gemmatimonadales bacterium]